MSLVPPDEAMGSVDDPSFDELITLKEAAKYSGLSYSHLRRLARKKEIWAKKFGTTWLTTRQAVNEYLARDRRPGPKAHDNSGQSQKKD